MWEHACTVERGASGGRGASAKGVRDDVPDVRPLEAHGVLVLSNHLPCIYARARGEWRWNVR